MVKKTAKTKTKKPKPKIEELDLDPDAWPKFERLLKDAAKKGPQPHGKAEGHAKKQNRR